MSKKENNIRIAKNTLMLYIRMIVVTLVSFYTVRISLEVLGVIDYGIQNVVAGLVSFLHIITASLGSANQRFLAFELGQNNIIGYSNIFSMLLNIYVIMSLIVLLVAEIIGPWFISTYLVIPEERMFAAFWAYQCAVFSFVSTLLIAPYMSSILAYERMHVYAYVSLYEVFAKLIVVYLLYLSIYDKLITISILTMSVQFSVLIIYIRYCKCYLNGCNYRITWDRTVFKQLMGYTGWNLFGSVSGTLATSGMTLLINMFFGPVVNAAKAIADRVNTVVFSFSSNFYQAIAPQIIKTYASGDIEYSRQLVISSSRLSFFLLFALTLPIIVGTKTFLVLWLGSKSVTYEMVFFSRLMLIFSLINVLEQPLTMIIRATGDIKKYQILVGSFCLAAVPIAYALFKMDFPSYYAIISLIFIYSFAHIIRLYVVKTQVGLSYRYYYQNVIVKIVRAIFIPVAFLIFMSIIGIQFDKFGWISLFFIIGIASVYGFGLTYSEKKLIRGKCTIFFKSLIKKYKSNVKFL